MFKDIKKLNLFIMLILFIFGNSVQADVCDVNDSNGFCLRANSEYLKKIEGISYFGEELEEQNRPAHTYFKISTSDEVLYCSDGTRSISGLNDSAEPIDKTCKEKSVNKNSLIFSYEYGYNEYGNNQYSYNTNYLSGNYLEDYYITQTAIWYFSPPTEDYFLDYWNNGWFKNYDLKNKTYFGIQNATVSRITSLINDAISAEGAKPSLDMSVSNYELIKNGDYYVSNAIKLTGKYLSKPIVLTVSGLDGAFITDDKNSNVKIEKIDTSNSFNIDKTLYVKIPISNVVENKVNIKIQAISESVFNDNTKVIECFPRKSDYDNRYQPLVKYVPSYISLSDALTFNKEKYPIEIIKMDTDNNFVKGATLLIKQNDQIVETWTTGNESREVFLEPGIYTIEENSTPDGYVASRESISFRLDNEGIIYIGDSSVDKITIVNKPIKIYISKRESKKDEELIGAVLKITDQNGQVVNDLNGIPLEWITDGTVKEIHIPAGTYILEESIAPLGYELSDKKIVFTVSEDGIVTSEVGSLIKNRKTYDNNLIVFENVQEPKQVPTGSYVLYISLVVAFISLGVMSFVVIKRIKK